MKISRYRICIFSEDPDSLQEFYRVALELPLNRKMDITDDYGYVFDLGPQIELYIARHSDIHGNNPETVRHIFDLQVNSVSDQFDKIKKYLGITVIAAPYQAPCSIVATFTDPEGNCWQLSENSECKSDE